MSEQVRGTPLPELPSRLCNSATIRGAYTQIQSLERDEQAAYNRDGTNDRSKRVMCARIVGYLILEGPSDQARVSVALEVVSCNNEVEKLLAIGQHYYDHYLRAFKKYKGRTSTPSEHVSRPSFETLRTMIKDMIVETPSNHRQAKSNALIRDGFRCILSGEYDITSVEHNKELEQAAETDGAAATECAHIFPESINANISGSNAQGDKHQYAAGIWAVLDCFGYNKIVHDLNGAKIHRLENVFTLSLDAHHYFNTLQLWFEPMDKPNTYKTCATRPFYIKSGWKRIVTFTTPDPEKLPVPSPDYFKLHAACCKVARLSGAGEHIDTILREMEDIQSTYSSPLRISGSPTFTLILLHSQMILTRKNVKIYLHTRSAEKCL